MKKYRKHYLGHHFVITTKKNLQYKQNFFYFVCLNKTVKNNTGYITATSLRKMTFILQQIPASENTLLAFQKFTKI